MKFNFPISQPNLETDFVFSKVGEPCVRKGVLAESKECFKQPQNSNWFGEETVSLLETALDTLGWDDSCLYTTKKGGGHSEAILELFKWLILSKIVVLEGRNNHFVWPSLLQSILDTWTKLLQMTIDQ